MRITKYILIVLYIFVIAPIRNNKVEASLMIVSLKNWAQIIFYHFQNHFILNNKINIISFDSIHFHNVYLCTNVN